MKYIAAILLSLVAFTATAQHRSVVSVEPNYERVYVYDEDRQVCQDVAVQSNGYHPTGAIVGGVIGYVIGREADRSRNYSRHESYRDYYGNGRGWQRDSYYSRRDNSRVGAYTGAVSGAMVGGYAGGGRVHYERRCYLERSHSGRYKDVQRGWRVTYFEHGRYVTVYQDHHPYR